MSLQEAVEVQRQALYVIAFYFVAFLGGGLIKDRKVLPYLWRDPLGHVHIGPWMRMLTTWWTIPAIFVLAGLIAVPAGMSSCENPSSWQQRDDGPSFCGIDVYEVQRNSEGFGITRMYLRIPSALAAYASGVLTFQVFVLIALAAGITTGACWLAWKTVRWTIVLTMAAGSKAVSLYKQYSPLRW